MFGHRQLRRICLHFTSSTRNFPNLYPSTLPLASIHLSFASPDISSIFPLPSQHRDLHIAARVIPRWPQERAPKLQSTAKPLRHSTSSSSTESTTTTPSLTTASPLPPDAAVRSAVQIPFAQHHPLLRPSHNILRSTPGNHARFANSRSFSLLHCLDYSPSHPSAPACASG